MIKIARKKKRKLKKKFVVIIIIAILIIIFLISLNSLDKISNNLVSKENNPIAELANPDNITSKEIYQKYECEEIVPQYIDNRLQINLNFKKDLFDEENNSNCEYFEDIIKELAKEYNTDFVLKDNTKNIIIDVKVHSLNDYDYTINNIEDYFNKADERNKEIKEYKEIETINKNISYTDFKKFDLNNWSVKAAGVKIQEKGDGFLNYGTYKILTNNIFINTIILSEEFKEEIIEGIKVGDSFDTTKKKIGEPTFVENNMIGYKINDVYAFFYNNEVSIYPNVKFENSQLEETIVKYINGEYSSIGKFSYDIIHTYLDFNSYIDDSNTVNLESAVRGIKITITETGNLNAEVYNNYNITEKTKKLIREEVMTTQFNKDLIYESEKTRIK